MLKLLAKIAEKYAKSTNTACIFWGMLHQPKMPASLVKKDQLENLQQINIIEQLFYMAARLLYKY